MSFLTAREFFNAPTIRFQNPLRFSGDGCSGAGLKAPQCNQDGRRRLRWKAEDLTESELRRY